MKTSKKVIGLVALLFVVWAAINTSIPTPSKSRVCSAEWFGYVVQHYFDISDGQGHGPDPGSREWLGSVEWKAKLSHDNHQGVVRIALRDGNTAFTMTVQRENVRADNGRDNGIIPGDGTVPVWSADAQARGLKPGVPGEKANGVQTVFTQGGYVHQFCYVHPWARWATLYSVLKITKSIEVPTP